MTALQMNQVKQMIATAKKEVADEPSVSYRTYEKAEVVAKIAEALKCFQDASEMSEKPINAKKFQTEAKFIQKMLVSSSLELEDSEEDEE